MKPYEIIPDHDDVIKWKHFPRYWPFARGIHQSPVESPKKGQRRRALVFFLCAPEQTAKQTIKTPVIWNTIALNTASLQWMIMEANPSTAPVTVDGNEHKKPLWYVIRLGFHIIGQVVLESYFCSLLRSINAHNRVLKFKK